jgi:hypothetical protein
MQGWIGRQPWVLAFSLTGYGIDIILSLNIQQECIHSLIVVEKKNFALLVTLNITALNSYTK